MESKVNYTLVGLFVAILGVGLLVIAFWLSTGLSNKNYTTYLAYMNESVTGLSLNAPVKYNGVDVGEVRKIQINPSNPRQVRLTLAIEENVPVNTETTATLGSQGLTGLSFVNLTGGSPKALPLLPQPGHRYAVIKTAPSLLFRLDATVREITNSVTSVSEHVNSVLDEENQKAFKELLKQLEALSTQLTEQVPPSLVEVQKMSKAIAKASSDTSTMMQESRIAINKLTSRIDELLEELQQNPSILIRGRQAAPPGPGE